MINKTVPSVFSTIRTPSTRAIFFHGIHFIVYVCIWSLLQQAALLNANIHPYCLFSLAPGATTAYYILFRRDAWLGIAFAPAFRYVLSGDYLLSMEPIITDFAFSIYYAMMGMALIKWGHCTGPMRSIKKFSRYIALAVPLTFPLPVLFSFVLSKISMIEHTEIMAVALNNLLSSLTNVLVSALFFLELFAALKNKLNGSITLDRHIPAFPLVGPISLISSFVIIGLFHPSFFTVGYLWLSWSGLIWLAFVTHPIILHGVGFLLCLFLGAFISPENNILTYKEVLAMLCVTFTVATLIELQRTEHWLLKKRRALRRLKQSRTDKLTGMANRSGILHQFEKALEHATTEKKHIQIMHLDLDHFKHINDFLGASVGDSVLVSSALRIKRCLPFDANVGRIGGDSFFVFRVVDPSDHSSPEDMYIKLSKEFETPVHLDGERYFLSLSAGICSFPQDGKHANSLLRIAEAALGQAKRQGRSTWRAFHPNMHTKRKHEFLIAQELKFALPNHEIQLMQQPIYALDTLTLHSREILARWTSAALGFIHTETFITVAERSSAIVDIGFWQIEEVLKFNQQNKHDSLSKTRYALNASPRQITHPGFVNHVAMLLNKYEIDGKHIEFEITERLFLEASEMVLSTLNQLSDLGISIAIDDFGTGFSALSYLQKLPISVIKIDKIFVQDVASNPHSRSIIKAIVGIANALDLKIVAEGIEMSEQLEILRDMGCHFGQGYFWQRPSPLSNLRNERFSQLNLSPSTNDFALF